MLCAVRSTLVELVLLFFPSHQGWDFESINAAKGNDDSSRFEMEPMNEMAVGHNVCLTSMVKSSLPDSFVWFAQVRRQRDGDY